MRRRAVLLLAVALGLGTTAGHAADRPEIVVFGASDLAFAFREIVPLFETATTSKVTVSLGSTGNLAAQIESGAPADAFFAADQAFVDRLVERGVLAGETRTVYAQGRLVLVTARASGVRARELRDLADPRVRHVAIANPAHAPYGRAAEEALRRAGMWTALGPKLIYGENVRQALQYVQSGAAEAGLVALSIARAPEIDAVPIDPALHAPLTQAAAVVRRSARPQLALAFIRFVTEGAGRAVMKRVGFMVPGEF